jgi:hypothetical protein
LLGPEIEDVVQVVVGEQRRCHCPLRSPLLTSPDSSRIWVETTTALPLECPFIEVSNLDERAGNADAKLYRRS